MLWSNTLGKSFHAFYSWDSQCIELRGMLRELRAVGEQVSYMLPVTVAPKHGANKSNLSSG